MNEDKKIIVNIEKMINQIKKKRGKLVTQKGEVGYAKGGSWLRNRPHKTARRAEHKS